MKDLLKLQSAYTKGSKRRDLYLTAPRLRQALTRYGENAKFWKSEDAALFPSQKHGHMTAASMARFLKTLFVEAGIPDASSHTKPQKLSRILSEVGL